MGYILYYTGYKTTVSTLLGILCVHAYQLPAILSEIFRINYVGYSVIIDVHCIDDVLIILDMFMLQ